MLDTHQVSDGVLHNTEGCSPDGSQTNHELTTTVTYNYQGFILYITHVIYEEKHFTHSHAQSIAESLAFGGETVAN